MIRLKSPSGTPPSVALAKPSIEPKRHSARPGATVLSVALAGAALSAASLPTHAFPIAPPGTEGLNVLASGPVTATVVATYQGNSATYSNDLYLERNASGAPGLDGNPANDLFIFNNHANSVGDTLDLGNFAGGVELVFRLHVNNTGNNFFSGDASRNADGLAHARVQADFAPNATLVSFEDLLGTPEGVNGFNDLSFSLAIPPAQRPTAACPMHPAP